ncbi:hypothetical protein [Luteolibacter soli]|uniref:Uncharacterized protein n=1 Tax=Luteolibacter soli TaxID=3135280 RepID=A0ABU9AW04_9BACT
MMRIFTMALLALNVGVMGWLIAGANMENPNGWEEYYELAMDRLDRLDEKRAGTVVSPAFRAALLEEARSKLRMAGGETRWRMEEYKRSDLALGLLSLCNIVGLAVIAFGRRKGA